MTLSAPPIAPTRPALLQALVNRPRLIGSACAGVVVFALLSLVPATLQWTLRTVIAWDVTCLCFIGLVLAEMRAEDVPDLKARCARQDEGKGLILGMVLIAVAASLVAVGVELSAAKDSQGLFKGIRIALAGCTVALSWFMVQVIFALHYAHQYYAPDETTPEEDDVIGGLAFPGNQEPDYWDFLHFAVVIGVACQTADIAFTHRRMRHIGTVQGLIAFTFNTVVLALTINLLAGLF